MTPTEAALRAALEAALEWLEGQSLFQEVPNHSLMQRIRAALAAPPHGKDALRRKPNPGGKPCAEAEDCDHEPSCFEDGKDAGEERREFNLLIEAAHDAGARAEVLQAELDEYKVTRSTGKEWLAQIAALQARLTEAEGLLALGNTIPGRLASLEEIRAFLKGTK